MVGVIKYMCLLDIGIEYKFCCWIKMYIEKKREIKC